MTLCLYLTDIYYNDIGNDNDYEYDNDNDDDDNVIQTINQSSDNENEYNIRVNEITTIITKEK